MRSLKNKLVVLAVFLLVVTNPLVAVHVEDGVNWVFYQIILYSGLVELLSLAFLVTLYVISYRRTNKVNVPKKTAKTKAQKYLAV